MQANVRGTDLGSFVADARRRVEAGLPLPPGYSIDWGGQFENQARAMRRLLVVVPAAVLIIFALLFATFDSVPQALLILLNVPFALVGGIGALWARGLNLNLSASVGFIALFGVAVLNGIVMVSYMNRLREDGMECRRAVLEGGPGATAAGADDGVGSEFRFPADGDLYLDRRGGAAAAGDGGDRRADHVDDADAVPVAGAVPVVLQGAGAGKRYGAKASGYWRRGCRCSWSTSSSKMARTILRYW